MYLKCLGTNIYYPISFMLYIEKLSTLLKEGVFYSSVLALLIQLFDLIQKFNFWGNIRFLLGY